MHLNSDITGSFKTICAVSSVVEHYLDTALLKTRNAPSLNAFSHGHPSRANISSNKVPNTSRFRRVERGLQRHLRTGELWFVGRRCGRVVWQRLGTQQLRCARALMAMLDSNPNGNTEISLVVDGKEHPLSKVRTVPRDLPLRRIRQLEVEAEQTDPLPAKPAIPERAKPSGTVPTLEELIRRWRQSKEGLKSGTLKKLDAHLQIMRRYVKTNRPVTEYRAQDIREFLAKARADKAKAGGRRLKGQTINTSIWRTLHDAFALALEEEFISRNPMDSVKREKPEPINRTQLNWAEAERVLGEVKARGNEESYLELKFMLLLGVGQAEAKDVTGGAVDWQASQITFVRQKTRKQYTVPIYPWAKEFIRTEITPRLKQANRSLFGAIRARRWRRPAKT